MRQSSPSRTNAVSMFARRIWVKRRRTAWDFSVSSPKRRRRVVAAGAGGRGGAAWGGASTTRARAGGADERGGASKAPLEPRDGLDLDAGTARQGRDLDCRARWRGGLSKEARVGRVERLELAEVREVDCRLYDVLQGGAGRLEDGFEVLQDALRLRLDAPADKLPRRRVEGDLPRQEEEVAGADGLRKIGRASCR